MRMVGNKALGEWQLNWLDSYLLGSFSRGGRASAGQQRASKQRVNLEEVASAASVCSTSSSISCAGDAVANKRS
jgi:hypothetical protein